MTKSGPELRQLSENLDNAANTWVNASLQLESAVRNEIAHSFDLSIIIIHPSAAAILVYSFPIFPTRKFYLGGINIVLGGFLGS